MNRTRTLFMVLIMLAWVLCLRAEDLILEDATRGLASSARLGITSLDPDQRARLERALKNRHDEEAETILVDHIGKRPRSPKLLALLGNIFFRDGKFLNSVIAFKKAEALGPLEERSRFVLALAFVILKQNRWARRELEMLLKSAPREARYYYWLSRVDYDDNRFVLAINNAQKAIQLDPALMKAYDNLGLCYEAQGKHDDAIRSYQEAVRRNREQNLPSPWPPRNLGALLVTLNRIEEAEEYLQESLRYAPHFPRAHYMLGRMWEKRKNYPEALRELKLAVQYDPTYPEPHYALGRIHWQQGREATAQAAWKRFKELKKKAGEKKFPTLTLPPESSVLTVTEEHASPSGTPAASTP